MNKCKNSFHLFAFYVSLVKTYTKFSNKRRCKYKCCTWCSNIAFFTTVYAALVTFSTLKKYLRPPLTLYLQWINCQIVGLYQDIRDRRHDMNPVATSSKRRQSLVPILGLSELYRYHLCFPLFYCDLNLSRGRYSEIPYV